MTSNRPRTYRLVRDQDVTGVSGTGTVADGVLWPDGTTTLRWRGEWPTTVTHDRGMASAEHIHGHDGRTHVEWDVDRVIPPDLAEVRRILTEAQQGEVEGWSATVMIDVLWGLARHVDSLLSEIAQLRASQGTPAAALLSQDHPLSEVDTLRAAAERLAKAAAWSFDNSGDAELAARHQYLADILATWATNGGVPRYGPATRAALTDQSTQTPTRR